MLGKDMTRGVVAVVVAGAVAGLLALVAVLPAPAQSPVGPFAGFKHDSTARIEIASDSLEVFVSPAGNEPGTAW